MLGTQRPFKHIEDVKPLNIESSASSMQSDDQRKFKKGESLKSEKRKEKGKQVWRGIINYYKLKTLNKKKES